ncbi:MAG: aldo/keto reductase [Hymenobacter sp.]|nr:MAG: aldo/keto reductase [Hymenobacter sp.]
MRAGHQPARPRRCGPGPPPPAGGAVRPGFCRPGRGRGAGPRPAGPCLPFVRYSSGESARTLRVFAQQKHSGAGALRARAPNAILRKAGLASRRFSARRSLLCALPQPASLPHPHRRRASLRGGLRAGVCSPKPRLSAPTTTPTPPLTERLALGTAQFGLAYGLNNHAGQPSATAVAEVLTAAQAAGLTLLDTAAAYGNSEARLGELVGQNSDFDLITKIPAGLPARVAQHLAGSLARLKRARVYGVLFHAFQPLQDEPAAWQALQAARAAGQVARIGVSLYHPHEAEWLLAENWDIDLVQVPYNVLDQRFAAVLPRLAARGVAVHVRSAFLQGLLLREPTALPEFFGPLASKLTRLRALVADAEVPLPAALLLFAAYAPGVARAVIGVDSVANLHENLAAAPYLAAVEKLRPALIELAEPTDTFILPYAWPPRP